MPRRARFALVYTLLGASLVAAGLVGYVARDSRVSPPPPAGRCWTRGADLGGALYEAARCRFGVAHVDRLGWMPYLGARANETLEEVAVLDPLGRASFWVARYALHGDRVEVSAWRPCPASNLYC